MAIKINFDVAHNPEEPTFILAKRNGDKLGKINAKAIEVSDNLNDASEITFNVYKHVDSKKDPLWDLIANFKLVYCVEWDKWFECTVEIDESNETMKTVFCTLLGVAELSQIMLYNIQINTDGEEGDIARDDYLIPTVLYRENERDITESDKEFYKEVFNKELGDSFADYKDASLLHRILKDKAPHYSVAHVDDTIKHMQRTFEFDDTSIYDACQEIAEELNCLFVFDSNSDEDGNISRTISVYDLESNCKSCSNRGEFFDVCPECGSTNIIDGYGEDTTVFITSDEIADDIQLTTEVDAIKNCFKLEAGDDLMTATIKNCNPNGSDYIWYLSDEMKADMSEELVGKIDEYNLEYEKYQNSEIELDEEGKALLLEYNKIVEKYRNLMNNDDLEYIESPIAGFPALVDAYYNTFDLHLYLESGLMPTIDTARPDIAKEIEKLTAKNLSPVAVNISSTASNPLKAAQVSTVDNIVLQMAKTLIDSRYKVKIVDNSILGFYEGFYEVDADGNYVLDENGNKKWNYVLNENGEKNYLIDTTENRSKYYKDGQPKHWRGNIVLTAYSDDEVKKSTNDDNPSFYIEIEVNDDYETFVRRKLDKALSADDAEDMSISGLFKKNLMADLAESVPVLVSGLEMEIEEVEELPETGNVGDAYIYNDSIYVWAEYEWKKGETEEDSFEYALKEYSLKRLTSFQDACQSCIDIMIEMGVADGKTWGNVENADLYNDLYMVYLNKLAAITEEINVRHSEIAVIIGTYDNDGSLEKDGLQTIIEKIKSDVQKKLDFEAFLGEKLWLEFCSFRREDKYSNDNYISDGKNNAEIINLAKEFIDTAKKEIYKSAELQCSVSANLKNLLVIEKFKPLVNSFSVGNWLRVMVDDKVYKLRLVSYTIDYDSLDGISVEFSDTVKSNSSIKSVKGVLEQASSMATSYPAVQRQASKGEESKEVINDWFSSGLDATNVKIIGGADGQCQTWDNHGMLFREYDESTGDYSPEQMKIINSTMAITTDNWNTTKTAVGKYYHADPDTGEMKMAYGINAETIVGKFILGENMTLSNESGSMVFDGDGLSVASGTGNDASTMTFNENGLVVQRGNNEVMSFDEDGLIVKHGNNEVSISPKSENVMSINNGSENVFQVNKDGELTIDGKITARSLKLADGVTIDSKAIPDLKLVAITGSYADLVGDLDNAGKVLSLDDEGGVEAVSLSYKNLYDYSDLAMDNDKLDIPTNNGSATAGQYLSKTSSGNTWKSATTSIASNGATPVSGSAVYKYAVAKSQGVANKGTLLYVGEDGNVETITIDRLKELLGI